MLPTEERRNYKNFVDAIRRIVSEEGVMTLWRGSGPTIARAISMNLGMLTTFDEAKERINKIRGTHDEMSTRIVSSVLAGIVCATMSLPADNIKTKV